MAERIILHCDLNNFFASVECIDRPEWKKVPMAVCGSVEERRGIVLAKNEKAKIFGVKTAETVWQAQIKCIIQRQSVQFMKDIPTALNRSEWMNAGWISPEAPSFSAAEKKLHMKSKSRSKRSWV